MSKLVWGKIGERLYEAGVDHGVLFLMDGTAVAWNGLVSIAEAPVGGEAKAYYHDGIKYMNVSASEDYSATLTAFAAPAEFAECDGTGTFGKGLFFTQQPRKHFNLVYRSLIGNDVDGTDHGYKLHLVYNILANPAPRTNATLSKEQSATQLAWTLDTVPEALFGARPTAHLIIDSTKTDPWLMEAVENILFGSDILDPDLPSAQEIMDLFNNWDTLVITDNGDGTWTATGPDELFTLVGDIFTITWPSAVATGPNSYTITSL